MEAHAINADAALERSLSSDFIRAVARLLEADPDDILRELGYRKPDPTQTLCVAEQHLTQQEIEAHSGDYYPG